MKCPKCGTEMQCGMAYCSCPKCWNPDAVTDNKEELKPCPFCGGAAKLIELSSFFKVRCENKDCRLIIDTPSYCYALNAINLWNTRVQTDKQETVSGTGSSSSNAYTPAYTPAFPSQQVQELDAKSEVKCGIKGKVTLVIMNGVVIDIVALEQEVERWKTENEELKQEVRRFSDSLITQGQYNTLDRNELSSLKSIAQTMAEALEFYAQDWEIIADAGDLRDELCHDAGAKAREELMSYYTFTNTKIKEEIKNLNCIPFERGEK